MKEKPANAIATCEPSAYTRRDQEAFAARGGLDYLGPVQTHKRFAGGETLLSRTTISEVYSFNAPDIGDWTFDVRGIKDMIVARTLPFKMFNAEMLGSAWYDHVLSKNGVERWRVDQLTGSDLRRPGIMVNWPQNEMQALIDGNHRLCARYERGSRTFRYAAVHFLDVLRARCVCRPGQENETFGPRICENNEDYVGGTFKSMTSEEYKAHFPNGPQQKQT